MRNFNLTKKVHPIAPFRMQKGRNSVENKSSRRSSLISHLYYGASEDFDNKTEEGNDFVCKDPDVVPSSSKVGIEQTELYACLNKFVFCLKLGGLFFVRDVERDKKGFNFWKFYSLIYIVINWLMFITFFIPTVTHVFELEFNNLATLISFNSWLFQNAINITFYHSLCRSGSFTVLFREYSVLFNCRDLQPVLSKGIVKISKIVLSVFLVIVLVETVGWTYLINSGVLWEYSGKTTILPLKLWYKSPVPEVIPTFCLVGGILATSVWVLPTAFFILMCLMIRFAFDNFNAMFRSEIERVRSVGVLGMDIEHYRLDYLTIVNVVTAVDQHFGWFVLTIYITNVCIISSLAYLMIFICSTGLYKLMQVFWGLAGLFLLSAISAAAATINSSAHKCLDDLHSISTRTANSKHILQATLFAIRVSGPQIGVTGLGFFTITKEFTLSVAGTLFSYFFLLVQFKSSDSCSSLLPNHNSTFV